MSITDELREWVRYLDDNPHLGSLTDFGKQALTNLADRIDEQHRRALERVAAMVDEPDELDRLDKRVKALEHLADGMLLAESEMEGRIGKLERKLNHRGVE